MREDRRPARAAAGGRVTAQFPPLAGLSARWPRLMGEADAAAYLSIGTTTLREKGPKPKKLGQRSLWDRRDLDRFADALAGQPLDDADAGSHSRDVERAWLESRANKDKANG